MDKKQFKQLTLKYLDNTCNNEELELLASYLRNNEYDELFKSFVELNYISDLAYKSFDLEAAKREIFTAIKTEKYLKDSSKTIPFYKKNIFKFSVAASIILFMCLTYIVRNNTYSLDTLEPIITNNTIETGTDKAILTLVDGSTVVLDKESDYKNENVSSNGEELIYKSSNTRGKTPVYNYLTVPRGGQFSIKLSDGTKVWLNSESQLKYPVDFVKGKTREVELVYGEAYFEVSASVLHDGAKFKVISEDQYVEVLGTKFNIKAYKEEKNIYTTLVEGKVMVNTFSEEQILVPNQQLDLDIDSKRIRVYNVDVDITISWKDGVFKFKESSLKDIMKVLSRWYDMDVVFENKSLEAVKFKGVLDRKQSIEEILSAIKSVSINNYEINNNTVIIK